MSTGASTRLVLFHDSVAPRVLSLGGISVLSATSNGNVLGIIKATVVFSESVFGFSSDKISVTGGSILNLSIRSNTGLKTTDTFEFEIFPFEQDTMVQIFIPANVVTDQAGNTNAFSSTLSVRHDLQPPSVMDFSATTLGSIAENTFDVKLVFDEPVANFSSSAINVLGGMPARLC